MIRRSLELACASGDLSWPDAAAVGGWWNRRFDPEIDVVGTDRGPVAKRIDFVGSIKWLSTPFDSRDLADLAENAVRVPGCTLGRTGLVVASLSGITDGLDMAGISRVWGPADVLAAWQPA